MGNNAFVKAMNLDRARRNPFEQSSERQGALNQAEEGAGGWQNKKRGFCSWGALLDTIMVFGEKEKQDRQNSNTIIKWCAGGICEMSAGKSEDRLRGYKICMFGQDF